MSKKRRTSPSKVHSPSAPLAVRGWPPSSYTVGLALFAIYFLVPYWRMAPSGILNKVFPWGIAVMCLIWGWCAGPIAGFPRWQRPSRSTLWDGLIMVGLGMILFALHFHALSMPFCWHGDEEFHVNRILHLDQVFGPILRREGWQLTGLLVLGIGVAGIIRASIGVKIWAPSVLLAIVVFGMSSLKLASPDPWLQKNTSYYLARYPVLPALLQALFANRIWGTFWIEGCHRMAAWLPMTLTVLGSYAWLRKEGLPIWTALTGPLVLGTMPMIWYHSTLLYIEPQAVLWMTCAGYVIWRCCCDPGLSCLYRFAAVASVGGLIKETALPFMAAACAACVLALMQLSEMRTRDRLSHALRLIVVITLPAIPYLYLRAKSGQRSYGFHPANLIASELYVNYLHSFRNYMTLPSIGLCLAGLGVASRNRSRWPATILVLLSAIGYGLFFALESVEYVGLARFMLYFFVTLLLGWIGLLVGIQEGRLPLPRWAQAGSIWGLTLILVAFHQIHRPPVPEERGEWGMVAGEQERHFPLDEAWAVVAEHSSQDTVVVMLGHDYAYFHMGFYMAKHRVPMADYQEAVGEHDLMKLLQACDVQGVQHAIFIYQRDRGEPSLRLEIPDVQLLRSCRLGPRGLDVIEYWRGNGP